MEINKDLELSLNRLICNLNVAKQNTFHAQCVVKGSGSIYLREAYKRYEEILNCYINDFTFRLLDINGTPITSLTEIVNGATMRSLKPTGFKTVPAILDTFIHLTEDVADCHAFAIELEDEVTANYMIMLNKWLESKIRELKMEFATPDLEESKKG